MPRTAPAQYRAERKVLGINSLQMAALVRIRVLHRRFTEGASIILKSQSSLTVAEMEAIASECEELIRKHFPEQAALRGLLRPKDKNEIRALAG